MNYYRSPPPTLAQQAWLLKAVQPASTIRLDRCGNRLTWVGTLQPTIASRTYITRIECMQNRLKPRVLIASPMLVEREGKPIPHLYPDGTLCLWQPAYYEWQPQFWIAKTVLCWASLWLFFYELWHACGEWLGEGEHPPDGNEK